MENKKQLNLFTEGVNLLKGTFTKLFFFALSNQARQSILRKCKNFKNSKTHKKYYWATTIYYRCLDNFISISKFESTVLNIRKYSHFNSGIFHTWYSQLLFIPKTDAVIQRPRKFKCFRKKNPFLNDGTI